VHKDTKSAGHAPLVVYGCEVDSSCTEVVEPWMGRNRRRCLLASKNGWFEPRWRT
jgi:hypothetical protein